MEVRNLVGDFFGMAFLWAKMFPSLVCLFIYLLSDFSIATDVPFIYGGANVCCILVWCHFNVELRIIFFNFLN